MLTDWIRPLLNRARRAPAPVAMNRLEWRSTVKWIAVLAIAVWLLNLLFEWLRRLLSWA